MALTGMKLTPEKGRGYWNDRAAIHNRVRRIGDVEFSDEYPHPDCRILPTGLPSFHAQAIESGLSC